MTFDGRIFWYFILISTLRLAFAGVYRETISSRIPASILGRILHPAKLSSTKVRKLHENLFYAIWHIYSFGMVYSQLSSEAWFFEMLDSKDPRHMLSQWPHFIYKDTEVVYLLELSFWLSCLTFMMVETIRSDSVELLLHHVATITLISLSYVYNYYRIGLVVMFLHDVGDVFLYSAKALNYLQQQRLTNFLFLSFVVSFVVCRLILFPIVVGATWGPATGYLGFTSLLPGCYILPTMLTVLQVLHIMWFGLIARMLYRMFRTHRNIERDIRSDDES